MKNNSTSTTFTPCLKKKFSKNKEGIINIRVTENRKSKYFSIQETINEDYWNHKRCEVKAKHPQSEMINIRINQKIEELKKVFLRTESIQELKLNDRHSFLVFFRNQINHLISRKKIGTSKNSQTCLKHIEGFVKSQGKVDLLFSEIDIEFVTDFETYILSKDIAPNTTKKYVSVFGRIFNTSIKMNIFIPTMNPFIMFENKRMPVQKKKLEKKDIEIIMNTEFDENEILFKIKNLFLFQIFAQGLRIGDLLTLKWSNLIDGDIQFVQLKTKKPHFIRLNEIVLLILKDFLPHRCKAIMEQKYSLTNDKNSPKMSFNEVKSYYDNISRELMSKFIQGDKESIEKIEYWKMVLDKIRTAVTMKIHIEINSYAKKHSGEFMFGLLDEKNFKEVLFNSETLLTKFQYNQISSKTTVYNKQLKRLQERCGIDVLFTSHLPRHTYTNLLIENTDRDIYSISKLIGHRRLSATENYVNEFNKDRVEKVSDELSSQFDFM